MKNTNIDSNSAVVRKNVADQFIAEFGAAYLNPLLGMSAGATCSKVESVMELLYHLTTQPDLVHEDTLPGITLVIQTTWAAMQYEREVFKQER